MKRTKLLLALTLMLALIACLFSVPALSGENPWDADGGNGGGTGTPLDSVLLDAGAINTAPVVTTPSQPENERPGWYDKFVTRASGFLLNVLSNWSTPAAQKNKFAF